MNRDDLWIDIIQFYGVRKTVDLNVGQKIADCFFKFSLTIDIPIHAPRILKKDIVSRFLNISRYRFNFRFSILRFFSAALPEASSRKYDSEEEQPK